MKQNHSNGLNFIDDNLLRLKNVRDGDIVFYTGIGNTCYN